MPPPPSATIYACDPGVVRANRQRNLDFRVRKNTAANIDDDLTFRADVIGEIRPGVHREDEQRERPCTGKNRFRNAS